MSTTAVPETAGLPHTHPLVFALAIGQLVGWGVLYFSFAVLTANMEAELGWSRSTLNGALTLGLLTAGVLAIPVGAFIDRRGGHIPMTAGAILGALMLVAWSQVTTPAEFYLVWFGMGLAHAGCLADTCFAVIVANIREWRRAITLTTFITGLCTTAAVPTIGWLGEHVGWRDTLLFLAAVQIVGAAVPHAIYLRGTTGSMQAGGAGRPAGILAPLRRAAVMPVFWALCVCFCAHVFLAGGLTFHMIPILLEWGFDKNQALLAMALHGPFQIAGRFILAFGGQDLPARTVGIFSMSLFAFAFLALGYLAPLGLAGLFVFLASYGIAHGTVTIVRATGVAEMLSREGYATLTGGLATVMILPRTFGPIGYAWLYELQHSYHAMMPILLGLALVGAAGFMVAAHLSRRQSLIETVTTGRPD